MGLAQAQVKNAAVARNETEVKLPPVLSEQIMKLQEKSEIKVMCKTAEIVAKSLKPGLSASVDLSLLSQEAAHIVESKVREKLPIGEYEVILVGKQLVINRKIKPKKLKVKCEEVKVEQKEMDVRAQKLSVFTSVVQALQKEYASKEVLQKQMPEFVSQVSIVQKELQTDTKYAQKQTPELIPQVKVIQEGETKTPGHVTIVTSQTKKPRVVRMKIKQILARKNAKKKGKRQAFR